MAAPAATEPHDALVARNVLWDVKGVGLYVEDGNELNNTLQDNVVLCPELAAGVSTCSAEGHEDSGIYLIGMSNHLLGNRVAGYDVGTYTPGEAKPIGQGVAWGRVKPQHFPFGDFARNVNHDNSCNLNNNKNDQLLGVVLTSHLIQHGYRVVKLGGVHEHSYS